MGFESRVDLNMTISDVDDFFGSRKLADDKFMRSLNFDQILQLLEDEPIPSGFSTVFDIDSEYPEIDFSKVDLDIDLDVPSKLDIQLMSSVKQTIDLEIQQLEAFIKDLEPKPKKPINVHQGEMLMIGQTRISTRKVNKRNEKDDSKFRRPKATSHKCIYCPKVHKKWKNSRRHQLEHTREWLDCSYCNFQARTVQGLRGHAFYHHVEVFENQKFTEMMGEFLRCQVTLGGPRWF